MERKGDGLGVTSAKLLSSLYAGQFAGILITAVTFIIVTRLLGAGGYGIYTFAFGFSALIDAAGNFGMGSYFGRNLARFYYRKDYAKVLETLTTGYSILLPIVGVLTLVGIAISPYVASVLFSRLEIAPVTLMLASGIIFFSTAETAATRALMGFTKGKLVSLVVVFVDVVQLAASVLLIYGGFGVDGAIGGMLVGYAIGAVLALCLVYKLVSRHVRIAIRMPSRSELRSALGYVLPLSMNNALNYGMMNFATLFISLFVTREVLGSYGAALRGLTFIAISYGTMATALLPIFSTAEASRSRKRVNGTYNEVLFYSLMATLPLLVFVAVLAGPGASVFLTKEYAGTGLFLTLIALGSLIDAFQFYISTLLISRGLTMPLVKTLAISTVVQLVTVLAAVPRMGPLGAILGIFFVGPVVESVLFARLARKLMGFVPDYGRLGHLVLGNLVLIPVLAVSLLLHAPLLELLAGIVLLVVAYPAIMVLVGAMRERELKTMEGISRKLPVFGMPMGLLLSYVRVLLGMRNGSAA